MKVARSVLRGLPFSNEGWLLDYLFFGMNLIELSSLNRGITLIIRQFNDNLIINMPNSFFYYFSNRAAGVEFLIFGPLACKRSTFPLNSNPQNSSKPTHTNKQSQKQVHVPTTLVVSISRFS